MKKFISKVTVIIAAVLLIGMNSFITTQFWHAETPEYNAFVGGFSGILKQSGEEYVINNTIELYEQGRYDAATIGRAIKAYYDAGMISAESVAKIEAAGIPVGAGASSAPAQASEASKPSKTEFSVTECSPYPAWAIKDCNIRSGADTTYDKAGSLKKFEQVTVTGTASTGWFRITTADGKEAYISNTLLTTEDPTKVSLTTVTEEGVITEHTVEGDNPEAVAQVVEQIKEESEPKEEAHEHAYTSSVTTEPTCSTVGTMTYTCECGDTYTEEIPKVEHTPGEWEITKKATLLSDGEKVQKCTVCGEVIATEVIPANKTMLYVIIGACVAVVAAIVGVIIHKKKH